MKGHLRYESYMTRDLDRCHYASEARDLGVDNAESNRNDAVHRPHLRSRFPLSPQSPILLNRKTTWTD